MDIAAQYRCPRVMINQQQAQLTKETREGAVADAHAALMREDADAAARLRPTDTTRVARALEVVRSTGRRLSDWQRERVGGIAGAVDLRPLLLLPPRAWLYERCDSRFDTMMSEEGL